MPHVENDGASIYYEWRGDPKNAAPPVVLIRGLARSLRYWLGFADRLADRRRLLLLDNRGLGRSQVGDKTFTVQQMATDVAAVMDDAGLARAHVFGLSLGGMVAQELALARPERIQSLVLGATTPGPRHGLRPAPSVVLRLLAANALPPAQSRALSTPLVLARLQGAEREALLAEWARLLQDEPPPRWTVLRQMLAAQRHDTWERLPSLRVPTLCITGSEDRLMPPENSERLAARIPDAEYLEMVGCGHDFVADDVRASADILLAFFERHDDTP